MSYITPTAVRAALMELEKKAFSNPPSLNVWWLKICAVSLSVFVVRRTIPFHSYFT